MQALRTKLTWSARTDDLCSYRLLSARGHDIPILTSSHLCSFDRERLMCFGSEPSCYSICEMDSSLSFQIQMLLSSLPGHLTNPTIWGTSAKTLNLRVGFCSVSWACHTFHIPRPWEISVATASMIIPQTIDPGTVHVGLHEKPRFLGLWLGPLNRQWLNG